MANRHKQIERNDSSDFITSSKDVYFVEAASILHNKADLGKQFSGFDSL